MARLVLAATLGAMTGLSILATSPVSAEVQYPWCATYRRDNGTNCGFNTYQQCLATISGVGGICYENPAYPEPAKRRIKSRGD